MPLKLRLRARSDSFVDSMKKTPLGVVSGLTQYQIEHFGEDNGGLSSGPGFYSNPALVQYGDFTLEFRFKADLTAFLATPINMYGYSMLAMLGTLERRHDNHNAIWYGTNVSIIAQRDSGNVVNVGCCASIFPQQTFNMENGTIGFDTPYKVDKRVRISRVGTLNTVEIVNGVLGAPTSTIISIDRNAEPVPAVVPGFLIQSEFGGNNRDSNPVIAEVEIQSVALNGVLLT